ncbi:DNA sulfur modification protein DndD [Clostridium cadaveris]|uniref:DNA sulfur modification protein DndD n=1 Tax=Clostridium cadaveris TaxID=1529 RepID=UPI000C073960|nr:DNA sulfur modification protein DndD [Clostridium cadaveris]
MIINSITLKNFRAYEDETTFSFTPNDGKNIVLIGGENGAGKSTLFEAIKLCIYGPIAYGYLGQNSNYITKVKNNINNNAFSNENIEAFISIDLSFKDGTEVKIYTLTRSWNYLNHRLNESFSVLLKGEELSNEDKLYFDKYLKSVLPPSLFDFFFFDGEELSEFFTGKSASSNLKEAVLELFNYDTFDVLKKQLLAFQRSQSKSSAKIEEAQNNFDSLSAIVLKLKEDIHNLEHTISVSTDLLDELLIKKSNTENDFRNSGGIFDEERAAITSEINKLESERIDINQYVKDFCNETLPFLLVSNKLIKMKEQIEKEDNLNSYNAIKEKLSGTIVKKSLNSAKLKYKPSNKVHDEVAAALLQNMFDTQSLDNVANILSLSSEQKNNIIFIINNILNKQSSLSKSLISKFTRTKEISLKTKELKEKLNSSVSEDILNVYLESMNSINKEITEIENILAVSKSKLEDTQEELQNKEYHLTRARNEYSNLLQGNNVLDMSKSLISYLETLLTRLTRDKISLIEDEFINIFSKIIRKDNYVNSIAIDDHFTCTLYINKEYTSTEVLNIIRNIGFDGIDKKYGPKFKEDLLSHYGVVSVKEVESKLIEDVFGNYCLSTKVNVNEFSNGEKQIYILCLIWSIIKTSGVEIPFIIDTPYARIDDTHRNSLTNTYLPNISKQVIILSTNKEIDTELYKVIEPYVCNEYLLLYNTEARKTEVKNGYFEV